MCTVYKCWGWFLFSSKSLFCIQFYCQWWTARNSHNTLPPAVIINNLSRQGSGCLRKSNVWLEVVKNSEKPDTEGENAWLRSYAWLGKRKTLNKTILFICTHAKVDLKLVQGVHFQSRIKSFREEFYINTNSSYDFLLTCRGCSDVPLPTKLILFTFNQSSLRFIESLTLILAGFEFWMKQILYSFYKSIKKVKYEVPLQSYWKRIHPFNVMGHRCHDQVTLMTSTSTDAHEVLFEQTQVCSLSHAFRPRYSSFNPCQIHWLSVTSLSELLILKSSCCGSSIIDHHSQNIQNESGWQPELACETISCTTRKLENTQPYFLAKTIW